MSEEILEKAKTKMAQSLEHLKEELKGVRTGRASPNFVASIELEVYGSKMHLRDIASITAPEPRQLLITPYDAHNVQACSKAIEKANLGLNPIVEGKSVRVIFPELDQNRRKELVKLCQELKEKAKVAIRNVRRECNEEIKEKKKDNIIQEDDVHRLEDIVQKKTDDSCHSVDEIVKAKEKDIMTI